MRGRLAEGVLQRKLRYLLPTARVVCSSMLYHDRLRGLQTMMPFKSLTTSEKRILQIHELYIRFWGFESAPTVEYYDTVLPPLVIELHVTPTSTQIGNRVMCPYIKTWYGAGAAPWRHVTVQTHAPFSCSISHWPQRDSDTHV